MMKYLSQINAFWNWAKLNELPSRAGYLYFAILDCANTAGWKREFNAPNSTLQAMAGLDKNGLARCRNILVQSGLIQYTAGRKGQSGTYTVIPLYDTNSDTNPSSIPLYDTNTDTNSEPILIPITNQYGVHTQDIDKNRKDKINTPPNLPRKVKENTKKEKVKEKGDVFGEFAGGNPELLEALRGFEQMRRGIKKPLTERAKQMVVDKLEKLSEPYRNRSGYQIACLNQSVLGCWQGVFELKEPFQDLPPEPVIEPETGEYRPPEWMGKENPTVEELFGVRFDP